MPASDFSPGHRALPRTFANPKESQLAEITQLLFQSALRKTSEKSHIGDGESWRGTDKSGLANRSLAPPLGGRRRADECRHTGSHTQRINLDGMARDTQHAMGQIGDSQSKERSTEKGSTAEREIFHQLICIYRTLKQRQLRKKETRRSDPAGSITI